MDFALTDQQAKLRDSLREFAAAELNTDLVRRDREQIFNRAGWTACAREGVQGLPVPKRYGGREADPLTIAAALEGLGNGCRDNGLWFGINAQLWGCTAPLLAFGTDAQKDQYLPRLCDGSRIGALALSEPEAGSDAFSLTTTATRRGKDYVLNGRKIFISNGPVADVTVVLATVDPGRGVDGITAFLLDKGTPGATMSAAVEKMGLRTVPMGELVLQDCVLSESQRLGGEGNGAAVFNHAMEWERGFILAGAVGAMARLLEDCRNYARTRRQFGQAIGAFQHVSGKLADMRVRLETARLMLYQFAWQKSRGRTALLEASMTKLHISEAWVQACEDALQIHAGHGYLTGSGIERDLRDALASRIYSGTSEIQRQIIARWMGLK